jgi:hypothetical protein
MRQRPKALKVRLYGVGTAQGVRKKEERREERREKEEAFKRASRLCFLLYLSKRGPGWRYERVYNGGNVPRV